MLRRKTTKHEKGAAAVEFALILPLLLFILFGTIEFGLVMFNKQVLTNASREGARFGIVVVSGGVRKTPDEISTVTLDYTKKEDGLGGLSSLLISFKEPVAPVIDPIVPCNTSGQDLTVGLSYQYNFLVVPDLSKLFGTEILPNNIMISARTVMKCE